MRTALTLLAAVLLAPATTLAQAGGGNPEDVETLDGILNAYYEVVPRAAGVR